MKPEVVFGLDDAAWPALLVNAGGAVLMFNSAARGVFGAALDGNPPQLASLWPANANANGPGAVGFLEQWEKTQSTPVDLKFCAASGDEKKFSTAIAMLSGEGNKWFLLQLFSQPEAPAGKKLVELNTEFRNATGDVALKQKLECVMQLARSVSLDLNNALTGVLAHTSLLLGKAEREHPWRRSLLEVEKSAARAAEIASELALFSRQEKETRRAPAGNLNAVVGRCLDAFRGAHSSVGWRLTPERALFEARYDEAKVQQALNKVLENAVESFKTHEQAQIVVETRNVELTQPTQDRNVRLAAGAYVCVEVSDNGSGIEETALTRVFEPFFTTKRSPHRGLGLALVYGIITNHGGGVAISSQAGKGTSTRIYLPAEKTFAQENITDQHALRGAGTILMVDDEALLLTMADAVLTDFGYHVLTASNGQKALEILERRDAAVDLIITDLVMPGMGGREFIERVRQLGLTLPILSTSGYVLPEGRQTPESYLQKPFTSLDLLRKVKHALTNGSIVD
jgi:signal transduction histidine kinase/CheY-like chemotaxis protein